MGHVASGKRSWLSKQQGLVGSLVSLRVAFQAGNTGAPTQL